MSLIERAVQKIGTSNAPPGTDRPAPSGEPRERTGSLIEAAMQAAARPADASAVAAPPAPAVDPAPAVVAAPAPPPATPASPAVHARAPQVRLDLRDLQARGFVTPDGPATELSQQFRVIKRPLLANAFGRGAASVTNGKRVMVTSAMPGEGKSFCAINLAMSIAAERDHTVVLVDADVARPSIPDTLGIEPQAGLMDWLIDGDADLDALVLPTTVDKLSILPAGRAHPHATEFIASDAMSRLLDALSARHPDAVFVFDSPPLLVTTEARELATHMGQIVMVVEAGRTSRDAVKEAIATIADCQVVGMVLNKAAEDRTKSYGSYYGYSGTGADRARR